MILRSQKQQRASQIASSPACFHHNFLPLRRVDSIHYLHMNRASHVITHFIIASSPALTNNHGRPHAAAASAAIYRINLLNRKLISIDEIVRFYGVGCATHNRTIISRREADTPNRSARPGLLFSTPTSSVQCKPWTAYLLAVSISISDVSHNRIKHRRRDQLGDYPSTLISFYFLLQNRICIQILKHHLGSSRIPLMEC